MRNFIRKWLSLVVLVVLATGFLLSWAGPAFLQGILSAMMALVAICGFASLIWLPIQALLAHEEWREHRTTTPEDIAAAPWAPALRAGAVWGTLMFGSEFARLCWRAGGFAWLFNPAGREMRAELHHLSIVWPAAGLVYAVIFRAITRPSEAKRQVEARD